MILFLLGLFLSPPSWANEIATTLNGVLLEKGTRTPLTGVNVYVLPSKNKATTDKKGRFAIESVPEGKFTWVIVFPGYKRLEVEDTALAGTKDERTIYLEKESYQVYETTIYDKELKRDNVVHVLTREEILKSPGSLGDPVRATQNLPGVNRAQALSSQIVIQGSGPRDTDYLLNGHSVPLIFHFGGLTSIMIPDAVDRVELYQAGYGPEWGRATGGLLNLVSRPPRHDRTHGLIFADLLNAGVMIEVPTGEKSGFLLAARRSYIGNVLRAAARGNENFNLTVAPEYSDVTALYASELTPRDTFQFTGFGSQDALQFLLKEPLKQDPVLRGTFDSGTSFFRLIPQLTHRHSDTTVSRLSLGVGKDWLHVVNNDTYFFLQQNVLTTRGEVERKWSELWTSFIGIDNEFSWSDVRISFPDSFSQGGIRNPLSTGVPKKAAIFSREARAGVYWRNEIKIPDTSWTLAPNARGEYFSQTREWLFSPRPSLRYQWDESLLLRGSGGLYYQPPEPEQTDATFGNSAVKSPRAWHADLGFDKDFKNGTASGWTISGDAFYKRLERLVTASSKVTGGTPENYNNGGSGYVYGAQTQIKLNANPWAVTAIYTLSRSRRSDGSHLDYPAQYDQTHLVGLVGSVQLPHNWSLSGRFRYASGNPRTPVVGGVFDADNDVFIPIRGEFYSQRLPAFFQTDLRFDKKWVFDTWILSLYLDIMNVTNRQNQEGVIYSYDYSQTQYLTGLPILPTLGLKGEF